MHRQKIISKIKKLSSLKVLRYLFGGGLAAILDLFLYYNFVEFFGLHYIVAAIYSFVLSFFFGFFFQKYITFQNYQKNHLRQGGLFLLFQCIGLGINIILLYIFVDVAGFHYFSVAIFNKFIIFVWNFLMNKHFNFR